MLIWLSHRGNLKQTEVQSYSKEKIDVARKVGMQKIESIPKEPFSAAQESRNPVLRLQRWMLDASENAPMDELSIHKYS